MALIRSPRIVQVTALGLALTLFAGCTANRAGKGAATGAGIGGVLGGIIGHRSGNTAAGVILGAAIGGTAGAAIGAYMDKQAAELSADLDGAKVERVGEGIKITFPSGILFDVDSDDLRGEAKENLNKFARVLKKYDDTEVMIQGHTDSTGSTRHNQKLSERRAEAVEDYVKSLGVSGGRLDASGLGEGNPVSDNGSSDGRQANRRVEVAIWANEKLKEAAKDGKI